MAKLPLLFLTVVCTAGSISAFSPSATPRARIRTIAIGVTTTPRGLPVVHSAKVLPIAYTSVSAALLFRATKAATKVDAAVLAATGALALFNLGPTDNARLASAKRAYKKSPPASSGIAKQRRQAAKTWRSVVRIKLVGQFVGLLLMAVAPKTSSKGILRGAATVMGANMVFFLYGAGGAMHNNDGNPAPMTPNAARAILTIDSILAGAALFAASSPLGTTKRN